jgi:heme-degrading monooxygenase HmoA
MYASVRTYKLNEGTVDEAMQKVDEGFAPILADSPGFVSYQAVNTGENTLVTVSVFDSEDQAHGSADAAASWVAENLPGIERTGAQSGEIQVSR